MGYELRTRNGYDFGEVASALQKSIRRGLVDDALFWATELYLSGYYKYAWKRLRVICSEDIGPANPSLPAVIDSLHRTFHDLRDGKTKHWQTSERLCFVHAVILLCESPKCRVVDHANIYHFAAHDDLAGEREIPEWALDKHTKKGKKMGRSWEHFFTEGTKLDEVGHEDPYEEKARAAKEAGMKKLYEPKRGTKGSKKKSNGGGSTSKRDDQYEAMAEAQQGGLF